MAVLPLYIDLESKSPNHYPSPPHNCECKYNKRVFWKGRTAEEQLKKDKNGVQLTPRHGNDNIKQGQGLDVCIDTIMTSQFMLMLSNH